MINFDEIQKKIYEFGEKIGLPKWELRIYNSPQNDGTPYIKIFEDSYLYISEENGKVFFEKTTDCIDELYYWIMDDFISKFSYKFELKNRIKNQDSRRLIFSKALELFSKINLKWVDRKKEYINNILESNPYSD